MKHIEVVQEWKNRCKATGSRMFTDGKVIYSYGEHFPIAVFVDCDTVLFNNDSYSSSTSKHQRYVLNSISSDITIIRVTTHEIKQFIRNPNKPLVIENMIKPTTMDEVMGFIEHYFKQNKIKRFQKKQIKQYLTQKFVGQKI
jgi:hypothetical protein